MFCPVVALHTGVGVYEKKSQNDVRSLIASALQTGKDLLLQNQDALDVCTEVCAILEDSPLTNAGVGSNLTREGTVELDALVMISDPPGLFGAVGALPGFKNPILIAKKLLKDQQKQSGTEASDEDDWQN